MWLCREICNVRQSNRSCCVLSGIILITLIISGTFKINMTVVRRRFTVSIRATLWKELEKVSISVCPSGTAKIWNPFPECLRKGRVLFSLWLLVLGRSKVSYPWMPHLYSWELLLFSAIMMALLMAATRGTSSFTQSFYLQLP